MEDRNTQTEKVKNIHLLSLVETVVYCLGIYIIFFHFSYFKLDFLNMNPHPLMIIVAIIALRYGVYSGIVAASVALIAYFVAYVKIGNDPVIFFYSIEYYKYIMIFFFTGLVLGKINDRNKQKIDELKVENQDINHAYRQQSEKNKKLIQVNENLEYQIVNSKESIITLHHILNSMKNQDIESIYKEAVNLIERYLKCEFVSLHLFDEKKENLISKIEVGEKIANCILAENNNLEIIKQLLDEKQPIEILKENKENKVIYYAAPIINSGEVIGILNIQTFENNSHGKYMFQLFKIISDWINHFLDLSSLNKI